MCGCVWRKLNDGENIMNREYFLQFSIIYLLFTRNHLCWRKESTRNYLTKSRRHPSKPISLRSQFSHSFMSLLTKSWEWSIFGAAWKMSPTAITNKQKVALITKTKTFHETELANFRMWASNISAHSNFYVMTNLCWL